MKRRIALFLALAFYVSILPPLVRGDVIKGNFSDIVTKGPWVDVRAFGAKCDNVTNDAVAIQNAINGTTSGSLLIPGMCAVGSAGWTGIASSKNNIRFVGANDNSGFHILVAPSQTEQGGAGAQPYLFKFSNSTGVTFDGLLFDGNGLKTGFIAFHNVVEPKVYRSKFINTLPWTTTGVVVPAIQGNGTTDMDVSFNTFDNVDLGPASGGGSALSDNVNTLTNVRTKFIGNTLKNLPGNGFIMGADEGVISGNTIYDSGRSAVILTSLWANGVFRGPRNISITGNTFKKVAWSCVQNDTINSTFSESTSVSGNTFDNCGSSGVYGYNVRGLNITGNTFRNGTNGILLQSADNVIASSNDMRDFTSSGLSLVVGTSDYLRNITISSNNIYSTNGTPEGISASYISGNHGNNLNIFGNTIYTYSYPIHIYNGIDNVMIFNNRLSNTSGLYYDIYSLDNTYTTYGANNIVSGPVLDPPLLEMFGSGNKKGYGTAAPTTGTWKVGDLWYNTAADNVVLWKCTAAGTPGTWATMSLP